MKFLIAFTVLMSLGACANKLVSQNEIKTSRIPASINWERTCYQEEVKANLLRVSLNLNTDSERRNWDFYPFGVFGGNEPMFKVIVDFISEGEIEETWSPKEGQIMAEGYVNFSELRSNVIADIYEYKIDVETKEIKRGKYYGKFSDLKCLYRSFQRN